MSKILVVIFSIGFISMNCGGGSVSEAECTPVVNQMIENLSKNSAKDENIDRLSAMKATIVPMLNKECRSGKYDLECLKKADNIAALQYCKKE